MKNNKNLKIVTLGLPGAGKSHLLHYLTNRKNAYQPGTAQLTTNIGTLADDVQVQIWDTPYNYVKYDNAKEKTYLKDLDGIILVLSDNPKIIPLENQINRVFNTIKENIPETENKITIFPVLLTSNESQQEILKFNLGNQIDDNIKNFPKTIQFNNNAICQITVNKDGALENVLALRNSLLEHAAPSKDITSIQKITADNKIKIITKIKNTLERKDTSDPSSTKKLASIKIAEYATKRGDSKDSCFTSEYNTCFAAMFKNKFASKGIKIDTAYKLTLILTNDDPTKKQEIINTLTTNHLKALNDGNLKKLWGEIKKDFPEVKKKLAIEDSTKQNYAKLCAFGRRP